MRKRVLLISLAFFLFLFPLFSQSSYKTLYDGGDYQSVLETARKKKISLERLYWEALAYQALGNHHASYETALLALSWGTKDSEKNSQLLRIALIEGFKAGDYKGVLNLMPSLTLDKETAALCYQAALQTGETEKAQELFTKYLRDTVTDFTYAQMLCGGGVDVAKVIEVAQNLSPEEKLEIYEDLSNRDLSQQDLEVLLKETQALIIERFGDTKLLYALLATLAERLDMRVLSRKYRVLSEK